VERETMGDRKKKELAEFVQRAMEQDAPIAFLNLSRGHEIQLQNWHWITITSVNIEENHIWTSHQMKEGSESSICCYGI
jgi:hypothetical protein